MFKSLRETLSAILFGSANESKPDSTVDEKECQEIENLFDMEVHKEGQIYLLDLNELLMEKILSYLSVPALAAFGRTSKIAKEVVN